MKIKSSKMLSLQKVVYDEMKDKATVGVIHDDAAKVTEIAVPVGVIAGLIPSTNRHQQSFTKH